MIFWVELQEINEKTRGAEILQAEPIALPKVSLCLVKLVNNINIAYFNCLFVINKTSSDS